MQSQTTHPSERRPVAVLSTDMVGYTSIVEALGEDRSLAFSRVIYKLMTDAVKSQGGTVSDFSGDSIMVVFGIPTAFEDSALRACRAAQAIHHSFAAAGSEIETQFGLRPQMRVGISSGVAVIAHADGVGSQLLAVGNTVNLAARIQALAPGGGSLICDTTRGQVEWLADLGFDGERQIKGMTKPQKLWQLLALRDGATRFDVSLARGLSPLFGRSAELKVMVDNLAASRLALRVVDVAAEPGQGKTRLVFEFLRRDELQGVTVLAGNCAADRQNMAFHPFIEILRQSFHLKSDDELSEISRQLEAGLQAAGLHTPENLGLLLNLLGFAPPAGALDGLDGVLIGLRTRDLLPMMLRAQCQASPVVLLIEDTHWIDSDSEALLRTLVEAADQPNLLILHLRRPEYRPDWLDRSVVTTLALAPLTNEDIRQLVQSRLGIETLPDALIQQVADRAGGNPLFGEEILIFLLQQGALNLTPGKQVFDASLGQSGIPASMQSLLAARMDRLLPEDRKVLQAAAVIGRRFDPGLLALVSANPAETGTRLQHLQDQGIVHREANSSDFTFKHVLLRDAVYQGLLSDDLAAFHLSIGQALESRSADRVTESAEILAYHFSRSNRPDLAFRYSVLAGTKSLGIYSLDAASQYFAAALALYEAAPDCAPDPDLARFLADYALCLNISLQPIKLSALAAQALPILKRIGDCPGHAHFLHHHIAGLIISTRFREARDVRRDLSDMAGRMGDGGSRAYALVSNLAVQCYIDALPSADFDGLQQEAQAALTHLDDAYLRNYFTAHVAYDRVCRGLVGKANDIVNQMMLDGQRMNDPRALGYGAAMRANICMIADDYVPALEMAEQALQTARADFETAIARNAYVAAAIPLMRPGALAAADDAIAGWTQSGQLLFTAGPEAMMGVGLALDGQIGKSIAHLETIIARFEAQGWDVAAGWARLYLCEIHLSVLSGQGDASLGVLLRNIGALAGILLFGAKRITVLLGQIRSVTAFDPSGHFIARTEVIEGSLHKIKKRRDAARHHLAKALRIVGPSGPSPFQTRIETALADL